MPASPPTRSRVSAPSGEGGARRGRRARAAVADAGGRAGHGWQPARFGQSTTRQSTGVLSWAWCQEGGGWRGRGRWGAGLKLLRQSRAVRHGCAGVIATTTRAARGMRTSSRTTKFGRYALRKQRMRWWATGAPGGREKKERDRHEKKSARTHQNGRDAGLQGPACHAALVVSGPRADGPPTQQQRHTPLTAAARWGAASGEPSRRVPNSKRGAGVHPGPLIKDDAGGVPPVPAGRASRA